MVCQLLQNIVLTHVHTWSHLVAYGELLVGLALTIGFLTGIAAFLWPIHESQLPAGRNC
jgi:uncharacterized membrane protein YphA (DoxX/SURF4 family)